MGRISQYAKTANQERKNIPMGINNSKKGENLDNPDIHFVQKVKEAETTIENYYTKMVEFGLEFKYSTQDIENQVKKMSSKDPTTRNDAMRNFIYAPGTKDNNQMFGIKYRKDGIQNKVILFTINQDKLKEINKEYKDPSLTDTAINQVLDLIKPTLQSTSQNSRQIQMKIEELRELGYELTDEAIQIMGFNIDTQNAPIRKTILSPVEIDKIKESGDSEILQKYMFVELEQYIKENSNIPNMRYLKQIISHVKPVEILSITTSSTGTIVQNEEILEALKQIPENKRNNKHDIYKQYIDKRTDYAKMLKKQENEREEAEEGIHKFVKSYTQADISKPSKGAEER